MTATLDILARFIEANPTKAQIETALATAYQLGKVDGGMEMARIGSAGDYPTPSPATSPRLPEKI